MTRMLKTGLPLATARVGFESKSFQTISSRSGTGYLTHLGTRSALTPLFLGNLGVVRLREPGQFHFSEFDISPSG